MIRTATVLVLAALVSTGCALVKLTPDGQKTRVLSADEVSNCTELGRTTTATTPEIVSIPRADSKIADELEILARNSAAQMGGDTVVPTSQINNGQETFDVYKCVP